MATTEVLTLTATDVAPEAFSPYGVVLRALADGTAFTDEEAALDVTEGTPRFYLMSLEDKPLTFTRITRHLHTTQTLMSVGGGGWFLAVAPAGSPDEDSAPRRDDIRAFRIPGDVAITLKKGTWHSGPFFAGATMDFVNLELSDTNVIDHHTYRLEEELGLRFVIEAA